MDDLFLNPHYKPINLELNKYWEHISYSESFFMLILTRRNCAARNKKDFSSFETKICILLKEKVDQNCPHPDENQRQQLSRELSLDPTQIKFRFQNKRTQNKDFKIKGLKNSSFIEIAATVMDELVELLHLKEPANHLKTASAWIESSKDSGVVAVAATHLIEMLLYSNKWKDLFPTIITEAGTIEVIDSGKFGGSLGSDGNVSSEIANISTGTHPSFRMDENSGDEMSYIPQVGDNQKPKIGMKFESLDEAFSFYNQYARESGFSARMSNSKKKWSKQSKSDEPIKERARGEIRTGCKSKISVVKEQTGLGWVISTFMESHNHPLSTPSKVHLLRSHRTVSAAKKALSQQFAEANVPTCQQMRLFEIESGGPEHVGCTERDIRNYEKTLRDEHKDIDAETLIDFFMSEKDKSSTFFFDYETDSDNRFIRCFWADPVSRRAYTAFGDVVVFDTTYNTNKYGMIFAPFVGVNHHHQTIIFGCGFLSDEKTDSFVWLLNKFLDVMPKGAPNLIITDQDPAITKAIAEVFPKTIHRYCLWHILNKFPDKLNPVTFRDHYQSIKNVIVHSTTSIEFERSWEDVMNCANLVENDWLSLMYELRHKWVPAYFNHVFSAGMSSSQRSEISHVFFKRYVCSKNSLMDFIIRFNKALRHQRHNELVADHTDMNERPKVKSNWPMELQMVNVYTKNKWLEFQNEISLSHGYYVQQASIGIEFGVYNIINFQGSSSAKHRLLTHDIQRDDISCSCMKFQFEGIPCRHMLAFFRINQVFHLPDQYILKRWTKDAKVGVLYTMAEQNLVDDPESIFQ
ncbi:protein FAR1-RELATED SEQUENCE 5-like [Primulina eburnea]|uniref:protein FAR1-RELATED SEQUENCE 5-like n=1 Tax=Primulina eburnea TaxID=1245227 RepID=UPI003C6BF4F0